MCVCRKQNVRLMEDWDWGVVRGETESRRAGGRRRVESKGRMIRCATFQLGHLKQAT